MRSIVRDTAASIAPPEQRDRDEAARAWGSAQAHARFQDTWACLNVLEVASPPVSDPPEAGMTLAAWNLERCKRVEDSAEVLRRAAADIVLATEMDLGMARSGQRHTTRDLARALGFGYTFGVEFVELGIGDEHESAQFAGQSNRHGLHGNAILSRWPLAKVALIPLDDGGAWFVRAPKSDGQYRVGGRMAVAAEVDTAGGPLVVVSVHLESESDARGRAAQVERLLAGMDELYGRGAAVVGGDLNTKGFLEAGLSGAAILADPIPAEPCFEAFERAGFEWRTCNTGEHTTRLPPWAPPDHPLKHLDWLFARGVEASRPFVLPALSEQGEYLSDHELVGARIEP